MKIPVASIAVARVRAFAAPRAVMKPEGPPPGQPLGGITGINPGQSITNPTVYYLNATVYGVFYIGVLLIAGILIFDRREV